MDTSALPAPRPHRHPGLRRWRILSLPAAAAVLVAAALAGGVAAPAQAAPLRLCTGADVRLSAEPVRGSAGAGSHSEALSATNVTGRICYLYGHPGVQRAQKQSATVYRPVGAPADWAGQRPTLVRLAPGHSATAVIRQHMVDAYPEGCRPVPTDTLRVYLPDTWTYIPVASKGRACTNTAYVTMEVGAFTATG